MFPMILCSHVAQIDMESVVCSDECCVYDITFIKIFWNNCCRCECMDIRAV